MSPLNPVCADNVSGLLFAAVAQVLSCSSSSHTWRTTWRTRTVWSVSGRPCAPTKRSPALAAWGAASPTPRRTARTPWSYVSPLRCMMKPRGNCRSRRPSLTAQNPGVIVWGGTYVDESCLSLADDHSRIHLKAENNHGNSDYINASPIVSIVYSL